MDIQDLELKTEYTESELSTFDAFSGPYINHRLGIGCIDCFLLARCRMMESWSHPPRTPSFAEYLFFCGLNHNVPMSFGSFRKRLPEAIERLQGANTGECTFCGASGASAAAHLMTL